MTMENDSISTFILLVIPILSYIIYWLANGRFKKFNLPGPQITPFFGNYFDLRKHNFQLHLLIHEYYKKFGEIFNFNYQGESVLVVADDEIIKQILVKQSTKFHNRKFFIDLPWPCDKMITMAKDEKWKSIRSLLTPAFTPSSLKKMSPLISKAGDTNLKKLKEASMNGKSIDAVSHSQGYIMESLLSISFSLDCPNQSDFNKTLISLANDFTEPAWWTNLVSILPFGQHLVKYIPAAYKHKLQPFIDTALGIVAGRRKDDMTKHKDLLQALLNAQGNKNGSVLTDEDVLAQGIVILTAVQVATSTTLALAMYYIAKHPTIQQQIVDEVLQHAEDSDFPSWDHITKNLVYLEQVLHETMRLHPSGFMLMRECTQSCTIEDIKFDKGTSVIIPVYSLHRDPKFWSEPEKFNPDRFSNEKHKGSHYIPFGDGPRACLGNRMAIIEMKMLLSKMLLGYEISLEDDHQVLDIRSHTTVQAMMQCHNQVKIKVQERNHNIVA